MHNAVFQILQKSSSLELTIASFHLLMELGKVKFLHPFSLPATFVQVEISPFPPFICHGAFDNA